ncbi:amidohydrolase family protein [Rhodococcus sp. IEGM 1381]|uniref:amidohydrolase n=1 Tax=Rhodococcus sp. IEGM 1381 TaxID=3047085 RepID=UPI0024B82E51|nr:amidohydrolase family protein [Rhodococcus sp. IEGM 1381]MDI9896882.1 amidohydrolase family protein [Rhodococcus sp. IEGM 1381]
MDWLIWNGSIETFDPILGRVEALGISGGRVVAAGTFAEVDARSTVETVRQDLSGRTVLPGFIDTHMHLEKASHEFTMLRLEHARSVAEVLQSVAGRARIIAPGGWIRCFADNAAWNEANLAEGRLPTAEELDSVSPDVAVYLYRRPDRAVINSVGARAMTDKLADFGIESYDPETGYLFGAAVRVVNDAIYVLGMNDTRHRLDILANACQKLLTMGITSVADPGLAGAFDSAWDLYTKLRSEHRLPQRIRLMNRFDWRRPFDTEYARVLGSSALPGTGDDRLAAWSLKLLLDGEFVNAWMRDGEGEPYPHYTVDELERVLRLCADRDWPICIHAMGGGAIGAILDAVRTLGDDRPQHISIAHAFHLDVLDIQACAELGIRISVNPPLAYVYSNEMRAAWGPLAARTMPLASMKALGFRFAAGSDTHPADPMVGAQIAVTRRAWDGSSIGAHEALDPRTALEMYTRDAGDYLGMPDLGTLAVGSIADLVCWSADPLAVEVSTWHELTPEWVAIDGTIVYDTTHTSDLQRISS